MCGLCWVSLSEICGFLCEHGAGWRWRRTRGRHCGYLYGRSKGKGAADRTRYGRTLISTKSFFVHHTQQMAKAAVMYDARAILKRVSVLKQQRLRTGTAAHAARAGEWA